MSIYGFCCIEDVLQLAVEFEDSIKDILCFDNSAWLCTSEKIIFWI
jgi:hypothetical protein